MKVNIKKMPDKYKTVIHENMNYGEISLLGSIIIKEKIEHFKNKYFGWYYDRKTKAKNRKKI